MKRSGSTGGSGAAAVGPPTFTVNPGDYRLMEEVGYGAHAVVYRAIFVPRDEVVAVKCLDLDRVNSNLVSSSANTASVLAPFLGFGSQDRFFFHDSSASGFDAPNVLCD